MGLPYEDELREMIEEEEALWRSEETLLDVLPSGVRTYHVVFKRKKHTITGGWFIRDIEPFSQELCDLLFQARDSIQPVPPCGISIGQMIEEAAVLINGEFGLHCFPKSDIVLYYDPDFPVEESDAD